MEPIAVSTPAGRSPRSMWRAMVARLTVGDGLLERPPLSDVLLAAALGGTALVAHAFDTAATPTTSFARATPWLGWVLIVVMYLPLPLRRVVPALTMAATGLATGAFLLLGYPMGTSSLAVLVALYSVAAYGSREDGRVSLWISLGFIVAGLGAAWLQGEPVRLTDLPANLFVFVGVWALGDRTRVRRAVVEQLTARAEEAERSRGLAAGLAVADERTRIARELHDIVAHTVSVVVVQAGAGRRIAAQDPQGAAQVLAGIEAIGREALAELRRLVGVLRSDRQVEDQLAPQPTLAEMSELVDRLADTGVPVQFTCRGEPRPLPSGVEVSAYRIVQEALTNVLRHAGDVGRIEVALRYGADHLLVRVRDDGRGAGTEAGATEEIGGARDHGQHRRPAARTPARSGGGAGLVGMRERVTMLGGTLQAGPRPTGGYEVVASLPIEHVGASRAAAVAP